MKSPRVANARKVYAYWWIWYTWFVEKACIGSAPCHYFNLHFSLFHFCSSVDQWILSPWTPVMITSWHFYLFFQLINKLGVCLTIQTTTSFAFGVAVLPQRNFFVPSFSTSWWFIFTFQHRTLSSSHWSEKEVVPMDSYDHIKDIWMFKPCVSSFFWWSYGLSPAGCLL